jgi:hypothetical protein
MPEANALYSVTAVVVVALVIWVIVVLRTAKEPWTRGPIAVLPPDAPPVDLTPAPSAPIDADSTARATPVALAGERRSKADES